MKRIYLPEGKRPTRKKRAASEKLVALYDYYAKTDLSCEKIAQHMGVHRQEQTGVDDKGKPILVRVLDVGTVEAQISWRRRGASGTEAQRATTAQTGVVHDGPAPKGDAQ